MLAPIEKKSIGHLVFITCCFAVILQSCFLFAPVAPKTGSLSVTVPSAKGARTVEPTETELAITSYRVEGISEDGINSFVPVVSTTTPITIDGLAPGNWSITVQ